MGEASVEYARLKCADGERCLGCTNIRFIPVSRAKGQQTPDLGADLGSEKVLCEVKTINPQNVFKIFKRHLHGPWSESTDF